jgi:Flp pilus assembly CpaE family ATPase
MKIRIALYTKDTEYSERITRYFQANYYDKFSWNVFTESSYLVDFLGKKAADIVLAGKELSDSVEKMFGGKKESGEAIWAYLTEDMEEEVPSGMYQIEKYARADKIYRELLNLYSHKETIHYRSESMVDDKTEIYAFVSAAGGNGASTIACAMAQGCAGLEKVLYINLENIGVPEVIFREEEQDGFDEILFALKSRRKVLELKLASVVSRDERGVYFFKESKSALDVMELKQGEIKELLMAIRQTREYDKVILDVGNGWGEKELAAMTYAGRVAVVIEDTEIAEKKLARYIDALQAVEKRDQIDICSKMVLVYNKVSKQKALPEQLGQIRVAARFPKIENGTYDGVTGKLAEMEMIHNIH